MLKRNLVFDQALAFLAGALTPLLPLLDSNKPLLILVVATLLGGVTGLRLFRNTAFSDNQAANRAVDLASASETHFGSPYPLIPSATLSLPTVFAPVGTTTIPPAGYISPTAS